jgi:hypothetical protein
MLCQKKLNTELACLFPLPRDPVGNVSSKRGNFVLLNMNNALQHARHQHRGVDELFSCGSCGRCIRLNTHRSATFLNARPSVTEGGNATCLIYMHAFKAQSVLYKHERLVHPVVRNEKGEKAAT